jgi:E3 ubiquitin-protein ligase RNF14
MLDCGHVFCLQCLQAFYNNTIKEGDLAAVRCLTPNCAKERSAAPDSPGKKRRQPRTFITPSELLQIGLSEETVKRYVTLKYKTQLESDKNTIYCPRTWCNGAARSKKHKPPQGLELSESFGDYSDEEEAMETSGGNGKFNPADLLAICEDCGFAFCSRCHQSWHGEFYRCLDKSEKAQLTAEEEASLEYLRLYTSPCPTCEAPAQKTHGCNHMICFRCATHFCYLCSAWLDPVNPYGHFNKQRDGKVTSCYMRLWELEGGDGAEVGLDFEGGVRDPQRQARHAAPQRAQMLPVVNIIPEIEEPDDGDDDTDDEAGLAAAGGGLFEVAREGPLVLRIGAEPAPGQGGRRPVPPPAPAAPVAAAQPARGGRGGHGVNRGAQRGRVNRGLGPRGRGGDRQNLQQQEGNQGARNVRQAVGNNMDDFAHLNAQHAAWVRRFVQMALRDEELDEDEEEDWPNGDPL